MANSNKTDTKADLQPSKNEKKTRIPQPIYGVAARVVRGRTYDTDHATPIAAYHHINPFSGIVEYKAHLWRTMDGYYFDTGFRFFDQEKWLTPLRQREAHHWLLYAQEIELAKTLIADLPVLLSPPEGHPELPMSINTQDVWREDFEIRLASMVWWHVSAPYHKLEGLYATRLNRFFLAEAVQFSAREFTYRIRSLDRYDATQWLLDVGVADLAEHYFPPQPSVLENSMAIGD